MKSHNVKKTIAALFMMVPYLIISAQEEIILNPAELTPHTDGYYVAGVYVDENNDGVLEFHNGCEDYYEDDVSDGFYDPHVNHAETGEQQGFTYHNCMIMPTCGHKSSPIDPPVATGYIQLHACMYSSPLTDSAIISYIQTPPVKNLTSIYMETSSDVSINANRQIPYNIEYSKDNGTTWEAAYLSDVVEAQGGYRVTYDGSVNLEIQEMIDASKVGPIVLRLITNDRKVPSPMQGQFVKVHSLKLTAEKISSVDKVNTDPRINYIIENHTIKANMGSVQVFNLAGQLIGSGTQVTVPHSGIYMVRLSDSSVQKVYIK